MPLKVNKLARIGINDSIDPHNRYLLRLVRSLARGEIDKLLDLSLFIVRRSSCSRSDNYFRVVF